MVRKDNLNPLQKELKRTKGIHCSDPEPKCFDKRLLEKSEKCNNWICSGYNDDNVKIWFNTKTNKHYVGELN